MDLKEIMNELKQLEIEQPEDQTLAIEETEAPKGIMEVVRWADLLSSDEECDDNKVFDTRAVRNQVEDFLNALYRNSQYIPTPANAEEANDLEMEVEESIIDLMDMIYFINSQQQIDYEETDQATATTDQVQTHEIESFRVLSWDIGMSIYKYIGTRAKAVVDLILKESFEIVLLQDVTYWVSKYLECRLGDKYEFFFGRERVENSPADFSATLIQRGIGTCVNTKIYYFLNTDVNSRKLIDEKRTLLKTEILIGGEKLWIFNAHLENLKKNSIIRTQQLKKCFEICNSVKFDINVILAGSFYITDHELVRIKQSKHLMDVWDMFGCEKNRKTWDLKANKLVHLQKPKKQNRGKRFDRIYFRGGQSSQMFPTSFDLIGMEPIMSEKRYYPSDHWALLTNIRMSLQPDREKRDEVRVAVSDEPQSSNETNEEE